MSGVQEEKKIPKYGSKDLVYNGLAIMTTGRLTKEDLMLNSKGKIVSKKSHQNGLRLIETLKSKKSSEPTAGEVQPEKKEIPKLKRVPRKKKAEIEIEEAHAAPFEVSPFSKNILRTEQEEAPKPKRTYKKRVKAPSSEVENIEQKE
jgi:cobalamin-dependent methionine synthase I